jgi:preprotein translocase subunit SecG
MTKATAVIASLFIICSLALTIISRAELTPTNSVLDIVEEKTEDTPAIPEDK